MSPTYHQPSTFRHEFRGRNSFQHAVEKCMCKPIKCFMSDAKPWLITGHTLGLSWLVWLEAKVNDVS